MQYKRGLLEMEARKAIAAQAQDSTSRKRAKKKGNVKVTGVD